MTATVRFDKWENTASTKSVTMDQIAGGSGLVPIVPTSVTVSSGTGSYDSATGLVTFSGAGTVTVNGVFNSTFTNYKVLMDGTLNGDTGIRFRMDNFTGLNYSWQWIRGYGSTVQVVSEASVGTGIYVTSGDGDGLSFNADIFNPNKALKTSTVFQGFGSSGSDFIYTGSGQVATTTQYTGFTLVPNSGLVSGTMKFYGYR